MFTLITVLLLPGCSSDDNEVPPINIGDLILESIVGNWEATKAEFTTTNANPVQSNDVVADGGFCVLAVAQNHSFTLVVRNASPDPQITRGQFLADGNDINVRFDTDPNTLVPWDFTLSPNTLFIAGPMLYDFENDGTSEEVSANFEFIPS
jgi:hypothetical protein